jgi:hypothetical protein
MNFTKLKTPMRKIYLLVLLFSTGAYASDSLKVSLNTRNFGKGDTLEFTCAVPNFAEQKLSNATLNVWIEDVQKHFRWKYRYPLINGEVSASLAISDKIPDGRYAINFSVQRGFFKVTGEVKDHEKKDTSIVYMMISKNKKGTYLDRAHVNTDGSFRLKSTLFADSAFFVFSPAKKVKYNYLAIKIETPLDSAYTPVLHETDFITVGNPDMLIRKRTDTSHYTFQPQEMPDPGTLPGVTVTTKARSKVEQYNEEYSGGLFRKDVVMIFDGLENDEIAHATSVLMFLQGRVPGLTVEKNAEGLDIARWRNAIVEIYIDEFRLDAADNIFVTPSDIAMIKVFRPPAQLSAFSGGAGAIAIYTKKGAYTDIGKARHTFIVKGYTNIESVWQ